MKQLLSPKQVSRAIGVSESSLKRWCDRGLIPTVRTAGGHRRLPLSGVLAYLRKNRQTIVAPELLGLPASTGRTLRTVERGRSQLRDALLGGDEPQSRQIIFDLWMSGHALSVLCDELIAAAFVDIGDKWACREADIFQERCACEIVVRILHELRQILPEGDRGWTALGGTIEGDQYVLPTTMAELVLCEAGWSARSLGSSLPMASLAAALRASRPKLFWVSVSYIADEPTLVRDFPMLVAAAEEAGAALVVGGFALRDAVREQLRYSAYCDTMQHLVRFAQSLRSVAASPPAAPVSPGENSVRASKNPG